MELKTQDRAEAMRPGGKSLWKYLLEKEVPFPRGKLFPAVYASLLLGNILKKGSKPKRMYTGKVSSIGLDDAEMERKKELIYRYKSQIPMLLETSPINCCAIFASPFREK